MSSPATFLEDQIASPYSAPDDNYNVHPSVLDMEEELGAGQTWNGYRYWMAFTPYPQQLTSTENPCIVASNDGDTWVEPPGVTNPLAPQPSGGYNSDPAIAMDPDGVTMHYIWRDYNQTTKVLITKHVSSTDGFATVSATTDILTLDLDTDTNELAPCLFYDSALSTWVMYSVLHRYAVDGSHNTLVRYTATSPTGTWGSRTLCTLPASYPGALRGPWHAEVRPDARAGGYLCVAGITSAGGSSGSHHAYALVSEDGLTFTDATLLLSPSGAANVGDWDSGQIYKLTSTYTASGRDVWYSAKGTVPGDVSYTDPGAEFRIGRSSFTIT